MLANRLGEHKSIYVPDYVVFDLETTGISVARDQVVEISAIKVQGGLVTGEFSTLVNPQMPIPWQASRVNGITDDMVAGSPVFREALAEFLKFTGDFVLVGHNIQAFDMKFLYRDSRLFWNRIPDNDYIDTLHMARRVLPQLRHHRLVDLADYYGLSTDGAHRALADCRMNLQVYEFMGRGVTDGACGAGLAGQAAIDKATAKMCPKCGCRLKKRSGRFGQFYGCEGFPLCRYTENIK
ncbi:MAG: topoisomerase DNA-binding C4 zinc finger domain-containing protein [Firmicutes bacterium]|nr:topoisomerase DNA-binding C4 zinc finger domain-containing protein [Bacillota bacterium]